jgi:two-component system, chemotaxis family, response regulator PixG
MNVEHSTPESLSDRLTVWSKEQLTGRLIVQGGDNLQWSVYICLGRLVWAGGGRHSLRRWRRLLNQHCAQLYASIRDGNYGEAAVVDSQEYQLLIQWVKQQRLTGEQAAAIVRSVFAEVLFDALQQEHQTKLTFTEDRMDELEASLTLLSADTTLTQAQQAWSQWNKSGLASISPDLAPIMRQPEQLQQSVSPQVYQTLVKVINGERTVRDVALLMKQEPLVLVRTLAPYVRQKLIELARIPDLPAPAPTETSSKGSGTASAAAKAAQARPLVVSVDDSYLERQTMERILTQAGYRFIGIEDAVQALPILLEQRPDMIFLDLVMPIANGYELCAQIRKISQFKDTPIVILTGNDGIVDRVRAKLVGASDFMGKPIEAERVLGVLQRFLSASGVTSAPTSLE